jgi:hypothetical protein
MTSPNIHRRWFHFFRCPQCGATSAHSFVANRRWWNTLFWCSECEAYARLKHGALVAGLWGVVLGGVIGPVTYLTFTDVSSLWWVPGGAGLAVGLAVWPFFGRICLRYEHPAQQHT